MSIPRLRSAFRAAQEIHNRCEGTVKQVHEHSRQIDPVIVKGAGAPHATQEEYQQKVEEAEYELLEEDAEQTHASEEELRVRIGGRPPAERED